MDKEDVTPTPTPPHTQNAVLLSHKEMNAILPFAKTRMDMEGIQESFH